jgi:transcriptional regulator with XRE-family HTH domain
VPGLRREEVAALAGMSVEYYIRIERGRLDGVSDSVIEALMNILLLNEAERKYLLNLLDLSNGKRPRKQTKRSEGVRPEILRLIESMENIPAILRNGRMEIIAANSLGRKLYCVMQERGGSPTNIARYFFLDPSANKFFLDWEKLAPETMGSLRSQITLDPTDETLSNLIAELSQESAYFRKHWNDHVVHEHSSAIKNLHHPSVGDLVLHFQALTLPGDEGLRLNTYIPAKGSPSEDAIRLLAMTELTLLNVD